jgi:hypothetical protein
MAGLFHFIVVASQERRNESSQKSGSVSIDVLGSGFYVITVMFFEMNVLICTNVVVYTQGFLQSVA